MEVKGVHIFIVLMGFLYLLMGVHYWIIPRIIIKNPISTKGIIISMDTYVAEQMKKNNSKWALVEIQINGKNYISSKKLQVSMNNSIGDAIDVIYDEKNPENMAIKKRNHIGIMLIFIGVMLIAHELYLKRLMV